MHISNTASGDFISTITDLNGGFTATLFGERADILEFYAEDAVGNVGNKITLPAGKHYDLNFTDAKHYDAITQQTYTLSLTNGNLVPSSTLDEVYINLGDIPETYSEILINGEQATSSGYREFVANNVSLNPGNTIKATYKDPYGGYGETTISLTVDETPPSTPKIDLITITRNNETVNIYGAPGTVEPYTWVTIVNTSTGQTISGIYTYDGSFSLSMVANRGEMLNIYSTDKFGRNSEVIKIPAGYDINITITKPTHNGAITYYGVETVEGYHDGPSGTRILLNSNIDAEMSGNYFSGLASISSPSYGIIVTARGPNDGFGYTTVYFTKEVMPPNPELISITYGNGNVTLIGQLQAVYPRNKLSINNSRTNYTKTINSNTDGSFTVTIPAEKGDTLKLIAIDDENYEQSKSTYLELGYLVDLAITSPLNGTEVSNQGLTVSGTHTGPATSTITVNGVQATVSENSFLADNVPVPESGLIEARLDDSDGAYGTTSITVTLDTTPPPAPNLDLIDIAFSAGDSVRLRGQAGSVEAGATLTITNTIQDVSTSVTVADDGSFGSSYIAAKNGETLTLIATDASGNQSAPATQQLGTEVLITINSPTAGTIVPSGWVTVTGTHGGPINSGIVINGVIAAVTENRFVALNVPIGEDGIITATLSALDGCHGQAQVSVMNLNQPVTLSLTPSSTEGVAPHHVSFDWSTATANATSEISIDYDGDGIFDQTTNDLTQVLEHEYNTAAINIVTLKLTMPDGSVQMAETVIVTHASDYIDAIFLSLWNGMNEALLTNEPNVALNYLNLGVQGQYSVTFKVIAPHMQEVVNSYQPPVQSTANERFFEYVIVRTINDSNQAFFIYGMKELDGTWRINTM